MLERHANRCLLLITPLSSTWCSQHTPPHTHLLMHTSSYTPSEPPNSVSVHLLIRRGERGAGSTTSAPASPPPLHHLLSTSTSTSTSSSPPPPLHLLSTSSLKKPLLHGGPPPTPCLVPPQGAKQETRPPGLPDRELTHHNVSPPHGLGRSAAGQLCHFLSCHFLSVSLPLWTRHLGGSAGVAFCCGDESRSE